MRLITFSDASGRRLGVAEGSDVLDVCRADRALPADMVELIALGPDALAAVREALPRAPRLALARLRLEAPLRPRRNVFAVGKNYAEHAREFQGSGFDATGKSELPDLPILFTKATTAVCASGDPIPASRDYTGSTDYEGELAVVIGSTARDVAPEQAMDHVFGYTIVNDVTSRTLQNQHRQWFLGKSLDGFCPMGPALLTADEVPDVGALRVQTRVNGELRQDAPVADLIFDIPRLIETLSRVLTLQPGDVIATGTPAGVGIGFRPPRFIKPGDRVEITIEPIGTLANPVV